VLIGPHPARRQASAILASTPTTSAAAIGCSTGGPADSGGVVVGQARSQTATPRRWSKARPSCQP
jgi:hypothetical protein